MPRPVRRHGPLTTKSWVILAVVVAMGVCSPLLLSVFWFAVHPRAVSVGGHSVHVKYPWMVRVDGEMTTLRRFDRLFMPATLTRSKVFLFPALRDAASTGDPASYKWADDMRLSWKEEGLSNVAQRAEGGAGNAFYCIEGEEAGEISNYCETTDGRMTLMFRGSAANRDAVLDMLGPAK